MAQLVARLVRNEKVGGSNPPSSTTGRHPIRMSVFCMPGRVGAVPVVALPLVFRAPDGPAAREARHPHFVRCRASKPARALRSLRRPSHRRRLVGVSSPARPRHRPRAPQPGYRTKRLGFVVTFRLFGAGKSALKLVVSSWGYEYPQMPGVRASDDQVWALSVRGAAMALHPVQYQPGQPH